MASLYQQLIYFVIAGSVNISLIVDYYRCMHKPRMRKWQPQFIMHCKE